MIYNSKKYNSISTQQDYMALLNVDVIITGKNRNHQLSMNVVNRKNA